MTGATVALPGRVLQIYRDDIYLVALSIDGRHVSALRSNRMVRASLHVSRGDHVFVELDPGNSERGRVLRRA